MHSFLLIGTNQTLLQKKIDELCTPVIHIFDKTYIKPEKSIGIEDIRTIQKNLSLTPVKSPLKAVILWHVETMTIPAQNAFLKTLEEPPTHTIIILISTTRESILETILSRCTIIQIHQAQKSEEALSFPTTLGEQLLAAQTYGKNKEISLSWIENILFQKRNQMHRNLSTSDAITIRQLQQAYNMIRHTNTAPRLILENLFLSSK